MTIGVKVQLDLRGMDGALAFLRESPPSPERRAMNNQWAARYEAFARRRFVRNSRGGGEWPPLSPATIARRRTGGKYRKYKPPGTTKTPRRGQAVREIRRRLATASNPTRAASLVRDLKYLSSGQGVAILRDTSTLFNALTIGTYGNLLRDIPGGVRYGFQDTPHGEAGGLTIAKIAGFHQTGAGHNPMRRILVQPDRQTVTGMMNDVGTAVRRAAAKGR